MALDVVALCPSEYPREDTGAIMDICKRLGRDTAARVMARSAAELAAAVATLASQARLAERGDVEWHSRRVQKLALGMGLISLAQVAGDLRRSYSDPTAFSAVLARLMRVAKLSFSSLPRN